jgi:hypothetical protein
MTKWIVGLFLITAAGCAKSNGASKYAGHWSGTYSSTILSTNPANFDTGTVFIAVDANSNAICTLQSLNGGTSVLKGSVDPGTGVISTSKYGEGDYGSTVFLEGLGGDLSADSGSGTLGFPWASRSNWQAAKN